MECWETGSQAVQVPQSSQSEQGKLVVTSEIYFLLFSTNFLFLRSGLSVTLMRKRSRKVFIHMKNQR